MCVPNIPSSSLVALELDDPSGDGVVGLVLSVFVVGGTRDRWEILELGDFSDVSPGSTATPSIS